MSVPGSTVWRMSSRITSEHGTLGQRLGMDDARLDFQRPRMPTNRWVTVRGHQALLVRWRHADTSRRVAGWERQVVTVADDGEIRQAWIAAHEITQHLCP